MFTTTIHPTAVIDPGTKIGSCVLIEPFVIIGTGVSIADNVTVRAQTMLRADTKIEENVTIGPFTIIAGATIGAGSQIYSHVNIGHALIHENVALGQGVRIEDQVEIGPETRIWHHSVALRGAKIGERCSFGQNVHIASGVEIGNGVKVQGNIAIYEGVVLHDNVFLGPAMVFTNVGNPRADINRKGEYAKTIVEEGATIGANATIICGHTIGRRAFVAAGALVTKDVPPFTLVVSKGAAAQVVGHVCDCGEVAGTEADQLWCYRCQKVVIVPSVGTALTSAATGN